MDKGFIKLSRKSFAHKFWTKARVFSEFEAWIDLIQSASFMNGETDEAIKSGYIDGREIKYGRGQYPASIRFLSKKWSWGDQRVRSFLNELKRDGSITTDSSQGINVITLCKYDKYNSNGDSENTANNTPYNTDITLLINELQAIKTQLSTQQITQSQHSDNTNNKKEKKDNTKKESPIGDKKETGVSSPSLNPDYLKFQDWIKRKAPYCANPKNFPSQITEEEFIRLKSKYSGKQIADIIEQIENRKDLRKRYTNLYRTVLNWAKNEYGKKELGKTGPLIVD